MADLTKVNIAANEIMKEADFTYGETREIENLNTLFDIMLNLSATDVIFSGGTVKERGTPSMNVDIEPILAFIRSTGKSVHSGSLFGPVAIDTGDASVRIDVLEVQFVETDFDSQQRAFKDPATGEVTFQSQDTKTRYELQAQMIKGTPGSGIAPNHTAGWLKLAEITVDVFESTAIYDADIENCTGGKEGEATANWTSETSATFVLKSLSAIKTILRAKHSEAGDHEDDVIQGQHLDWGTATNQVDADLMPLGTIITHAPTGGTAAGLTAGSVVRAAVQKILDLLIDLSGVENDAVDARHMNWGTSAGQIDADLMPLGTAVTSSPTGGTATNLVAGSFVRAAIQAVFDRLIDLSGAGNNAVVNRHIGPNAVRENEVDLGIDAGDIDADVVPLGTAVTSSPTGGTTTNLVNTSFVRAAIQEVFNRLKDLSGVQNAAVVNRHLGDNSVRQQELDLGIDAGDIDADVLPLGTAVTSSPTGGTATNLANTTFVRNALQTILNRLIDLSGVQNDAVIARHVGFNADGVPTSATKKWLTTAAQTFTGLKTFASRFIGAAQLFHIRDEKSEGTAGGDFIQDVWQKRVLNTVKTNEISGASVSSSVITLPSGTYWIYARCPASNVDGHKAKLRNTSDTSDALIGGNAFAVKAGGNTDAIVMGRVTIGSTKNFELQHRCDASQTGYGFGPPRSHGVVEVYTEIYIQKVA